MNYKENLKNALTGQTVERKPFVSVTQLGTIDAMKHYGLKWPDAHQDANQMATLASSLYELAGLECARLPFCLTVEAEALGCDVNLGSNERVPEVEISPFEYADDIEATDDFTKRGRIPVVLEAIDILKEKYEELPIIVGITGPFTLT